jgi:hypothetical protein
VVVIRTKEQRYLTSQQLIIDIVVAQACNQYFYITVSIDTVQQSCLLGTLYFSYGYWHKTFHQKATSKVQYTSSWTDWLLTLKDQLPQE